VDVTKDQAIKPSRSQRWAADIHNNRHRIQKPAEEMPERTYDRISISIWAFFCSQGGPIMIPQKSGSIINIASMSGIAVNVPQKQAIYNTSKAGVAMLTKSLALEWAPCGIRVNSISPGYMKTEMTMAHDALSLPGNHLRRRSSACQNCAAGDIPGFQFQLLMARPGYRRGYTIETDRIGIFQQSASASANRSR
jgi:NAD(P)-dependent dehydrogenase (short-subunit alcohol dehydrogenase family)